MDYLRGMTKVYLRKKIAQRIANGHPWIFGNEVEKVTGPVEAGDIVDVFYADGKLISIISCFDGNGKQLDKGTLKDGNGTLNLYDIDGNLLEVQNFKDGEFIK